MSRIIPIGCDHAGFELKEYLKEYLTEKGYEVKDYGTYSADSTDYPDYAHAVSDFVENNEDILGILICGSGNGISMTANKHQGIRCALCWETEIAELARLHNNANIIALPARFISREAAIEMVDTFFSTEFEGGRHANRVNKIACS
ncbi:ribose 5-phosphate isomerase B [Wandonia haliotis]|uniref:Ribose 5-phosphate isomerase B n=1 Tax=Wandonia haliotis TaxID=574963 RepID=A0ABN1ML20_9FLAO